MCPSLVEIHYLLAVVQQALPQQGMTSNGAEVFNARHDRQNRYWGRKSVVHATRDAKAWAVVTFFPEGARKLLGRKFWTLSLPLLRKLGGLMISRVNIT